jgi:hypothetical protein
MTGNKGEWSEIYTLFKLLGDGILKPGNENIEVIQNAFYPIIKILRTESNGTFEYSLEDDIVVISGNIEAIRVPISEFKKQSLLLLKTIKENPDRTFEIPSVEHFMKSISCISLKADSSTKTDITIIVHDQRTNQQPVLGFSIKSQLGNPSTLLNAGKTTNFVFEIKDSKLQKENYEIINAIESKNKIKDRIDIILKTGGHFEFIETEQSIFENNLILIDSLLPDILALMVYDFYTSANSKTIDLVKKLEEDNPLSFDVSNKHKFYEYKIKRLLTDIALGMMPSKVWAGEYDATGGYLIVKEDGEILCYHIYNRSEFESYLLVNTKFDTASSTRHDFGKVYELDNRLFFNLNLQIRFLK